MHCVSAVLIAQGAQALRAKPRAADLAAQVADDDLGHAAVVAQDRLNLAVDAFLGPVPDRRDQHAVVKNLARRGAGRSGHEAADIGLVGDAGAEGNDFAAIEDRRNHHHIGHM